MVVNKSVTLPCEVSGVPTPQRSWLRHGLTLAEISGKYSSVDSTLVIKKVDLADSGDYQCMATNIGGTASWIIALNVLCNSIDLNYLWYMSSDLSALCCDSCS